MIESDENNRAIFKYTSNKRVKNKVEIVFADDVTKYT